MDVADADADSDSDEASGDWVSAFSRQRGYFLLDDPSEELHAAARAQLRLLRRIFVEAARLGVTSIALPAISSGKRNFPPLLNAGLTLAVAATEVLASGGALRVYCVSWGDENHFDAFVCAKEAALSRMAPAPGWGA